MRPLRLISPIFTLLLSSCALYAPDERAELNNIPERFSLYSEDAPDMQNRWWESFGSAELNTLIDEALTNSPTIQQAWARLAQAEAIAAKAGAARIPSLGYETSTSGRRNMQTKSTLKNYDLGFSASYELDLWGRVQSQTEAAALDRAASREQLNSAAVSLAAQTALRWTGIISQKLQTELIRSQLES
ncbi:MAG: TolC family protein, partial [Pontiella sp.]|nr:TolC family protein [Pontiella sp.]